MRKVNTIISRQQALPTKFLYLIKFLQPGARFDAGCFYLCTANTIPLLRESKNFKENLLANSLQKQCFQDKFTSEFYARTKVLINHLQITVLQ